MRAISFLDGIIIALAPVRESEVRLMMRGKILSPQIRSRGLTSEELLMLAVLEQAFNDLDSNCPAIRADAEAYFLAYGANSSAFSLENVCHQFKLSPDAIRTEVRRRVKQREAKLRSVSQAAA